MDILKQNKNIIGKVAKELNRGKVIVCPTDTIYGFLAIAENKKAVDKIFKIKKRPKSKHLAVFVKDIKFAKELAEILPEQEKILKQKWPGKFSFILKRKNSSAKLYGLDKKTIAIRIPKYKFLNNLLKRVNKPLVQTSVNVSKGPALLKVEDIKKQFGKYDILLIDAGNLQKRKPSKIVDLTSEAQKIVRY